MIPPAVISKINFGHLTGFLIVFERPNPNSPPPKKPYKPPITNNMDKP